MNVRNMSVEVTAVMTGISNPVMKGDPWQKMTNDEKVAFIRRAVHVVYYWCFEKETKI